MSENTEYIENTLTIYDDRDYGLCSDCNQLKTKYNWCQNCNSKWFQQDFSKWTSGNKFIDKFIQDAQLKARSGEEVIEWISYNRLRNIKYLAKGGFSIVYKAILLDGCIREWDSEKQQWERSFIELKDEDYENAKQENIKSPLNENEKNGKHVVLKSLNNSSNINDGFLNEWKNYLNFIYSTSNDDSLSVQLYGITQDPETLNYMIVMQYMELGNLRSNLMIKKFNPIEKYDNLFYIAKSLLSLHKCNLVHGDFHSGNLLLVNYYLACISDLGLSKPVDKPTVESSEIYGVLPYIAPEVLRGNPYTKAADIYSFGIIMWEMTSGIPAFNKVPHDFKLALNICQGLRPEIVEVPKIFDDREKQKKFEDTEVEYIILMKRCWDPDPDKRPTAEKLHKDFNELLGKVPINQRMPVPVPKNELIIQNHPSSCYTSKKIGYSAKLNEILNSKIVIDNIKENNETLLSESLEDCIIHDSDIDSVQGFSDEEKEFDE